jgi:hypothetical protein
MRVQAMPQLTAADAAQAAGLVLRRMPREHAAIVHAMSPQPELQFKYLKVHHLGSTFLSPRVEYTHGCWLLCLATTTGVLKPHVRRPKEEQTLVILL